MSFFVVFRAARHLQATHTLLGLAILLGGCYCIVPLLLRKWVLRAGPGLIGSEESG